MMAMIAERLCVRQDILSRLDAFRRNEGEGNSTKALVRNCMEERFLMRHLVRD
jgi:hypothetical protein